MALPLHYGSRFKRQDEEDVSTFREREKKHIETNTITSQALLRHCQMKSVLIDSKKKSL